MEEESDDELMIRLQSGDSSAFDVLVRRHQGGLIGFFMRNTRDIQFSEDLAQETLLKIYVQHWDYLPLGRFKSWMYRIGRNLLVDNVRRHAHDALIRAVKRSSEEEQLGLARLVAELIPPEAGIESSEVLAVVDDILAEIPPEQCETFTLHVYSELSLPEVAEITGVPLATAKSRFRLAREKLKEKLQIRGFADLSGPEIPGSS